MKSNDWGFVFKSPNPFIPLKTLNVKLKVTIIREFLDKNTLILKKKLYVENQNNT